MSGDIEKVSARTPAVIAQEITAEHEAAQGAFRLAVEHAIRCGELLIEAKAALPHGSWGEWIGENFPASKRTAQGYMRLARAEDTQALAHLGIEGALKQLSAPKSDDRGEANRRAFEEFAEAGIIFTATGIEFPDDLSFEDWQEIGQFLASLPCEAT